MNTRNYYFYKFFIEFVLVYPVYPLLFESKGMSVAQISILLAIWTIPALLLEVPSGVIADRWSRKKLIVTGSILKGLCFACWIFADGFTLFAAGFILWGIGSTLNSGAEEALLFDSLKNQGREDTFDRVLGKGRFFSGLSLALACLTGGYLTDLLGMDFILIFSIVSTLITTGISLTFTEVNLYRERLDAVKVSAKSRNKGETLKDSILFFKHRRNTILVVLSIMVIGTAGVLDEYDSLIAEDFGLSFTVIGVWVCIRGLMSAVGGLTAPYIKKFLNRLFHFRRKMSVIFLIGFTGAIFLFIAGALQELWIMGLYGLYYLLMSACEVLAEDYLQQRIDEEGRSTVHSILSLLLNLFGMIFFCLLGSIITMGNLFTGLMFTAVYMVVVIIILCIVDKRIKPETATVN